MPLTWVEKERLVDTRMKLQAAANTLKHIDPEKVPDFDDIENCLDNAEKSLATAIGAPKYGSPR